MLNDRIDLHTHSTASDGKLTPAQLVERAKKVGLKALALTDHDTIAGLQMFHQAGKVHGIETISGVEISATFEKGTMHIVGLFVETDGQEFRAFLRQLGEGRRIRNPQIINKLNALGMVISMSEVEQEAGVIGDAEVGGAIDKSIGRPHIAAVMINKGYVKSKQEAFDKYLAKGKPAYFTRFSVSPEQSIAHIHNAAGLAILAHPPYLRAADDADMEIIVADLKNNGLDGIEVYYSTHTPAQTELCARLAQKYNLAVSGGSDFHADAGRSGTKIELGQGISKTLYIKYEVLEKLKELKARRR